MGSTKARRPPKKDAKFGERLTRAMEDMDVRPGQLAKRMGNHPVTVSRWRAGYRPDAQTVNRVAATLGVALNWLKTGQGAMIDVEPGPPLDVGELSPQSLAVALQQIEVMRTMLAQVEVSVRAAVREQEVNRVTAEVESAEANHPQQPAEVPDEQQRKSG